jgi:hypothetical protein
MNRRTSKEVIEKGNPKTEQAYIKFPREELIKVSREEDEKKNQAGYTLDTNKLPKKFYALHTHLYKKGKKGFAIPSSEDLYSLGHVLKNTSKYKGEIIAQRGYNSGELQGYTFLSPDENNIWNDSMKNKSLLKQYNKELNRYKLFEKFSLKWTYDKLKDICDEYNLKIKFVPEKGYYFNKKTGNFEKNKNSDLEKVVASIMGISILLFALFNVVNINGFVVNNSRNVGSINLFWTLAIILLGITFFVIRKKHKK